MVTTHYAEKSAPFESPLLKGHPSALARGSVERVSPVFRYDGF